MHAVEVCLAAACCILLVASPSYADDATARQDYVLSCQGCHGPQGDGAGPVPGLRNYVGNFLHVPGGREFIVQVPGSANSALDDASLARLLNWMMREFSEDQLPANFEPYTATEVAQLRKTPINDIVSV